MTTYTHRYLARIILEAATPLAVGSGERDVITDQLVTTDVNGLPYIPGTALAGVLRNALEPEIGKDVIEKLMGYQGKDNDGQGSRLILSHAQIIGVDGLPIDGIVEIDWENSFYKEFQNLPVRQHVRISHKGASEKGGKFDEQVVYKGSRFCFEMELVSDGTDENIWKNILNTFRSPLFRMGGGTRKGFGELTVKDCKSKILDLTDRNKLSNYLDKTSSLNDIFWSFESDPKIEIDSDKWIKYELKLKPENFFLFSSGLESADAKMIPVTEKIIDWDKLMNKPHFMKEQVLIPASSVKGALAHRVAFHYNKFAKVTSEKIAEEAKKTDKSFVDVAKNYTGENNPAVRALFGYSASNDDGQRGNTIFSDLHLKEPANKKLLNHVAIDCFTGGAMDGALFSEEVVGSKEAFTLTCLVNSCVKSEYLDAFGRTLDDLCSGMLPLGGGTMRGHGCYKGTFTNNRKELENEQ